MPITEHTRTDTHKLNFMNIHGCISYASLQQTAGKHLAMKQSLSLSPFSTLLSVFFSLHPLHQPCSLSITICLISFLFLSLSNARIPTSLYFSILWSLHGRWWGIISVPPPTHDITHPCPSISLVLKILVHMPSFDDYSYHSQTTSTCMTSLSLNYPPLISTA